MNEIINYFHTDWSAMTQHDWLGLLMTILVFFIMIGLYTYIFHPSNKERWEAMRNIPLEDDNSPSTPSNEVNREQAATSNGLEIQQ